jgi:cobalamin biosynthesis protein CobT
MRAARIRFGAYPRLPNWASETCLKFRAMLRDIDQSWRKHRTREKEKGEKLTPPEWLSHFIEGESEDDASKDDEDSGEDEASEEEVEDEEGEEEEEEEEDEAEADDATIAKKPASKVKAKGTDYIFGWSDEMKVRVQNVAGDVGRANPTFRHVSHTVLTWVSWECFGLLPECELARSATLAM